MTLDPIAARIARDTFRSYDEVRRGLRWLEANGWGFGAAEQFVEQAARANLDVREAAEAVVQAGAALNDEADDALVSMWLARARGPKVDE